MVVSVGGEGTNNEVLNGFFEGDTPVNEEAVLGLLPSGTACDFAKVLGIPKDIDMAADVLVHGQPKSCDIGKARFAAHDERTVERFFLNVVDIGIGGETVARVNRTTKAFGATVSYLYSFLVSLLKYKNKPVRLIVDEEDMGETVIKGIAISNGKRCGGGMQVAPNASVDDGLFDVLVVGDISRTESLRHLPKLYGGTLMLPNKVQRRRARRISVMSSERVLIDLDGEQPGMLPATFEVLPHAVRIQVPADAQGKITAKSEPL
jgi:YegS/Rv2252/BmrU family lipid kinase